MADINNPQLNRFLNEQLRPLAEKYRALQAEAQAMLDQYQSDILPILNAAANTDTIVDGRAAQGVNQLTVGEVKQMRLGVVNINTEYEGKRTFFARPCVRPLSAT